MSYKSLKDCVNDLEKNGHLIRIKEEVDPNLEMAAIHLRVFENNGPALLFENIKGTQFPAVSNLFGTLERSKFMFRDTLEHVQQLVSIKGNPEQVFKNPFNYISTGIKALNALPKKTNNAPILWKKTTIDKLPLIKCWPKDGGAFVTLPQVYTEDIDSPGVMKSNLGMYRIQLSGNDYELNKEIGLHYQIHRGIGVHQTKANKLGKPLKVSIFVGGHPAHTLAAVMPLPEGLSELTFAGSLSGRRFRYTEQNGHVYSSEADFVITGEVYPQSNKPEGPFGDHLGYYSLTHDFPLMKVTGVYHRKDAIWPFTVVGRPPQEDTQFGALIHEITGPVIPKEIPGLHEINAVDAAGVHPLLFAIGSERYTPYLETKRPQELLTIANHILGSGQLSLAKYLFISAKEDNPKITTNNEADFLQNILERIDLKSDLHFYTNSTIDTLDYSGTGLNSGSKIAIAATGKIKRELGTTIPEINLPESIKEVKVVMPGVLSVSGPSFSDYQSTDELINNISERNKTNKQLASQFPLIVLADDAEFVAKTINNFLWVTFTRSNPSHDIYGIDAFTKFKHWGCNGSLVIDARIKPHHAPPLILDPDIEKRVDSLATKGKSLYGII